MRRSTLAHTALCCVAAIILLACPYQRAAGATSPNASGASSNAAIASPAGGHASASVPAVSVPPEVSENYRIVEEDILRLDVWNEQQLSNIQMQVTTDGKVNVPFLGPVQATGLTQGELAQEIVKKLADAQILYDAKVQITITTLHQPLVRVLGQVNRPGACVFKDGDRVLDAVALAGSYTDTAMLESATLTHKGSDKPIPLDLRKMMDGDLTQNYELRNADTIYIPPSDYQDKIYVLGQVQRPGIYDLKKKTTVMAAIGLAGGPTDRGAMRSTIVVRGSPGKPDRVKCNLARLIDKGDMSQDVTLQSGDVVLVPETKKPDWNKISSVLNSALSITYISKYGLL